VNENGDEIGERFGFFTRYPFSSPFSLTDFPFHSFQNFFDHI